MFTRPAGRRIDLIPLAANWPLDCTSPLQANAAPYSTVQYSTRTALGFPHFTLLTSMERSIVIPRFDYEEIEQGLI